MGEYALTICKHCSIWHKECECPWVCVSMGLWNQSAPQILRKNQMVGTRENMEARWRECANLAEVWRVSYRMGHSLEDLCRKWAAGPVAPWRKTIPGRETSPTKAPWRGGAWYVKAQQEAVFPGTAKESRAEQNALSSAIKIAPFLWAQ